MTGSLAGLVDAARRLTPRRVEVGDTWPGSAAPVTSACPRGIAIRQCAPVRVPSMPAWWLHRGNTKLRMVTATGSAGPWWSAGEVICGLLEGRCGAAGWLLHEGFPVGWPPGRPCRSAVFSWSASRSRTAVVPRSSAWCCACCGHLLRGRVVCQKLALGHASAVQVTTFGCFTGTAACLPFAGQLLSQLGAPYNPRGHNLTRSRPSRHGDQRARRMTTGPSTWSERTIE